MKARYFTSEQKKYIKQAAHKVATAELDSALIRQRHLYMVAMKCAGLSNKTINRVMNTELPKVCKTYAKFKEDGLGDYVMYKDLKDWGFNVEMPKEEL